MQTDLSLTRIGMAEHAYPAPTRNLLSEQQRRKLLPIPKGSEIRYGIRTPDGNSYMGLTDSEIAVQDALTIANKLHDRNERKRRITEMVTTRTAATDNWAHKS